MTEYEAFRAILTRAKILVYEANEGGYADPEYQQLVFKVGPGIAGSTDGLATAIFNPDGTLYSIMWCD